MNVMNYITTAMSVLKKFLNKKGLEKYKLIFHFVKYGY